MREPVITASPSYGKDDILRPVRLDPSPLKLPEKADAETAVLISTCPVEKSP